MMRIAADLMQLGWALTSPFEDEQTRRACDEILGSSDPSAVMQGLYRVLISEKGIRAALGQLERAGADLDKLSISSDVVRKTFPMNLHPIWSLPAGSRLTLRQLANVLTRHHDLLWQTTLEVSRTLGSQRFVLLSGTAIESLFPDYKERTAFDSDLWVPGLAEGLDALEVLVKDLGFTLKAARLKHVGSKYHIDADVCKKVDGYEVDLGLLGGEYHSYSESLDQRAVKVRRESQMLRAASPEDLLVMRAVLVRERHRIQMVSAGDAAVILRGTSSLDFSLVRHLSRTYGLDVELGVLLGHVDARWPGTVPTELRGLIRSAPQFYLTLFRRPWRRPQAIPLWEMLARELADMHGGPPLRGWMHAAGLVLAGETRRRAAGWENAARSRLGAQLISQRGGVRRNLPLCGAATQDLARHFPECAGTRPEARWDARAESEVRDAADRIIAMTTAATHHCEYLIVRH